MFLLTWFIALSRQADSALAAVEERLDSIERKLRVLKDLESRLSLLVPKPASQTEFGIGGILEEKPLFLFSIDTSRTSEFQSLKGPLDYLKTRPILPNSLPPAIFAPQGAPLFVFKAVGLTVARKIVIDPWIVEALCSVRMVRFEFYYENDLIFKSRVVNLPTTFQDEWEIELAGDVIFDSMVINVIKNWGNDFETCMGGFHVHGPNVN
jgi:hypothetical protein